MVTGSDDCTAKVWDLDMGSALSGELKGFSNAIWSAKFTADGRWLALGSLDGTVRVWDRHELWRAPDVFTAEGNITAIAVTPDSRRLIAGSSDSRLGVWQLGAAHLAPELLTDHEDWISVVTTTSDNRWLISGSGDKTVRIRRLDKLSDPAVILRGHGGCVRAAHVSEDNRLLATCGDDGSVQLVDLNDPGRAADPKYLSNGRAPVAISADSRVAATASVSNELLLDRLDRPDGSTVAKNLGGGRILALAASPDGRWIAAGTEGKDAVLVSPEDYRIVRLEGHLWGIRALAFTPDSRILATGSDDHTIRFWDLESRHTVWQYRLNREVRVIAFSPDGSWLTAGDGTGTVHIWNREELDREPQKLPRQTDYVWNLKISPDSRWLITNGYRDKDVSIWKLDSPAVLVKYLRHPEWVTDVAFTPDSTRVAIVTEDPFVRLWQLSDLDRPPSVFRGHEWGIRSVAIHGDGTLLVTGSDDKTSRVWPLERPEDFPVGLRGHEASITDVQISADRHWLMTASFFGPTRIWNLRLDELIDLGQLVAGRNFTFEEWQQYFPGPPYAKTFETFPVPVEAAMDLLMRAAASANHGDFERAAEAYRTAVQWASEIDDLGFCEYAVEQARAAGFAV
jgi:WD40 repeat protein